MGVNVLRRPSSLGNLVTIPHHFRCPISLELMQDPVTLCTGQTYDRGSIEQWLSEGNVMCPVTGQPLQDLSLTPNHMLLRLLQAWCVANRWQGVERVPTPKQPATSYQVSSLTRGLSSPSASPRQKAVALSRLGTLASDCQKSRALISDMGAVPLIVEALFDDGAGREVAEEALAALAALLPLVSYCSIAEPARVRFLAVLLRGAAPRSRVNAAVLLESMAVCAGPRGDEMRTLIGTTDGIMEGLANLLRHDEAAPGAMKAAVRAIFALCLSSSNWENAARASGLGVALLESLPSLERGETERALACMEMLCKTAHGREAVGAHALTICALKQVMLKVSDRASECAAGVLLAICSHFERAQEEAVEEGIFTQLLLLLQTQCTPRAKKKARCLLKLLRDNWADHPCIRAPGIRDLVQY